MMAAKMHRGQYVMNMHRSIVGFMLFIFPTVGNARNYGIEHVQGEYFTFIDSDDFIDPGFYKEVLRLHRQTPSDVYLFGYKDYPLNSSDGHRLKQCRCDDTESLAQLYLDMKKNYLMFSVINKIFNSIENRKHRFLTNIHYFEDCLFALDCLGKAKSVGVIEQAPYNYVHHPENILHRRWWLK
jgi:glycosyltransferase involved in cell wall biosynthesis